MCAGHPDLHAICTRVLDCARTRPCARPHLHPCLRACPRLRPRPSLAHTNVHVHTMPAPTTMQAMGARTTHTTGIAHPCVHCTCAHKLVASMDMCVCVCVHETRHVVRYVSIYARFNPKYQYLLFSPRLTCWQGQHAYGWVRVAIHMLHTSPHTCLCTSLHACCCTFMPMRLRVCMQACALACIH